MKFDTDMREVFDSAVFYLQQEMPVVLARSDIETALTRRIRGFHIGQPDQTETQAFYNFLKADPNLNSQFYIKADQKLREILEQGVGTVTVLVDGQPRPK